MSFLIDTNVISELRRGRRADARVITWFSALDPRAIYLSVVTVGEIRKGIERIRHRGDHVAARSLDDWLSKLVDTYGTRILPIDQVIAERWGRLNVPDPVSVLDGLLAATALVHGLTVATRNLADFEPTGAACLNPFR